MATIAFEGFMGTTPDWTDLAANTLVFSSSLTDLTAPITVATWQDGTHAGSNDPGTDQCGANHMNNVKWLTSSTMSVNGAASENIIDANLAANECSLRIHFNHSSAVVVTGVSIYCYDGSTPANPGVEVDMQAFERGVSASAWTVLNNYSGSVGGTGSAMSLANSGSATDHYWYLALSISPETVGSKALVDLGATLTYS